MAKRPITVKGSDGARARHGSRHIDVHHSRVNEEAEVKANPTPQQAKKSERRLYNQLQGWGASSN